MRRSRQGALTLESLVGNLGNHRGHDLLRASQLIRSNQQVDPTPETKRGIDRAAVIRCHEGFDRASGENALSNSSLTSGAEGPQHDAFGHNHQSLSDVLVTRPALLFWYQTMKTTAAAKSPPTITIGKMILLVLEELSEGAAPWFGGGVLGVALGGGAPAVESRVGSGRTGGFSTEVGADPAA
jgi:hypothetical protein